MAHPRAMDSHATTALTPAHASGDPQQRLTRFAWGVLGYTLFVVLFGAVVRITGSGAGCGQHWPSCNGELLHVPQTLHTVIELTHRVTSGLLLIASITLLYGAFRVHPRGHSARAAAVMAFAMTVVEALIGAVLVLLRLVVNDASFGRILALPLHLVSVSLLTAALTWCAYFSMIGMSKLRPLPSTARTLLLLAGIGILLVSATGAVTALGDTVYPVKASGLSARLQEDQGASAHLLQRMRGIHPFLAIAVAAFVAYTALLIPGYCTNPHVKRASLALVVCVFLQVCAGALNVWLSAPGPMQVLHLLLANFTWISLILLAAAARLQDSPSPA